MGREGPCREGLPTPPSWLEEQGGHCLGCSSVPWLLGEGPSWWSGHSFPTWGWTGDVRGAFHQVQQMGLGEG